MELSKKEELKTIEKKQVSKVKTKSK